MKQAKLRWRCRRGTLELDRLLNRYLELFFQSACDQEKAAFESFLELQDNQLMEYLMGGVEPTDEQFQAIKRKILSSGNMDP
ncbi:MAG: succinate dehydrogenase assembly factor 2 [Methylococcaceae bacterium]